MYNNRLRHDHLVGSERKRYTLLSRLAAYHSEPLGVLINGSMSEAKESFAVLRDIDQDKFVRFCQYLYTGDYDAADADDHTPLSRDVEMEAASAISMQKMTFQSETI